ncbi:hypothetical protein [Okeania sp. SIO3B5]|nr:hypothetical protein [Okeania sp. SIO3B5]
MVNQPTVLDKSISGTICSRPCTSRSIRIFPDFTELLIINN